MTENVKRPDLNALIADAESYVGMDEYPGAVLIRKLATALAAERARADQMVPREQYDGLMYTRRATEQARDDYERERDEALAAFAADRARADGAESDAQSSLNERAVEAAQGVIQAHYRRAKAAEARADQAEQRIADAPHDNGCGARRMTRDYVNLGQPCTCWKSAAPIAEQES